MYYVGMKRNEIIKRIKEGLKIAVATTLLAASLTSCGINNQEFASQEEIVQVGETLDCDLSYMLKENGKFLRMKHNDGEPIYICFDDDFSNELKDTAIKSLDYVFGIVGKINSNYHYKIVEKTEFDLKFNKTKIYYTFGEHVSNYKEHEVVADAHLNYHSLWYNFAIDNPVCNYYELNLSQDRAKEDSKKIISSLNHELLHAFGFGDVYTDELRQTTDKYYGNTFMNTGIKFDRITPNDLACLIALYAEDDNIDYLKEELEKYEKKFYNQFANDCKKKIGTDQDFDKDVFNWSTHITISDLDGKKTGYEYKVDVENGQYKLEIYDYFTKELLDNCTGEVVEINGVLVLKDVELKHGMRPFDKYEHYEGGFIQDFVFVQKDNKDILYNYFNNEIMSGNCYEFEKSLTR